MDIKTYGQQVSNLLIQLGLKNKLSKTFSSYQLGVNVFDVELKDFDKNKIVNT